MRCSFIFIMHCIVEQCECPQKQTGIFNDDNNSYSISICDIYNFFFFDFVIVCTAVWTNCVTISEKWVMRAQESSSNQVNTSPSSSQETDREWAHPRPPGPGRKWEEEEEREVAGSQRETEWGEIGRGSAHHERSKTKVMHRCSQNKHISGVAFSKSCCL